MMVLTRKMAAVWYSGLKRTVATLIIETSAGTKSSRASIRTRVVNRRNEHPVDAKAR